MKKRKTNNNHESIKNKLADIDNAVFLSEFRNDEIQESTEFVVASHYDELKSKFDSAERTLKHLGYENLGGEMWKPPIGKVPKFINEIKELQNLSFGDIKNKVGTKFKVPQLHKTRIFMICRKVTIPNEIMVLNTSTNAVFEVSTGIISDNTIVEIINN